MAKPTHPLLRLAPRGDDGVVHVVVETPRGSAHKLTFDAERGVFVLKKALPAGMVFPFDFGFVPGTRGGDGDPLDVLVLLDGTTPPGVLVVLMSAFSRRVEMAPTPPCTNGVTVCRPCMGRRSSTFAS